MPIVWDEAKRLANLAKHGLDFADFEESFDMETFKAFAAKPSRTGLNRFLLIGRWHDDAVVAVILSPPRIRSRVAGQPPPGLAEGKESLMTGAVSSSGYVPNPDFTQEDWNTVCDNPELTDDELAQLRPARDVLPSALFEGLTKRRGRPPLHHRKVPVTIRLDPETVEAFKATGEGWQTRMNDILSAAAKHLAAPTAKRG